MAIAPLASPFTITPANGFATVTTAPITVATPALATIVTAYVQNVTTPADTFSVSDSNTNTWVKDETGFLASNDQIVIGIAKITTPWTTADSYTVTNNTITRAKRVIGAFAFSGAEAAGAVLSTPATFSLTTNTPSVTVTTPEDNCIVIGVLGHNGSTGVMTWTGMSGAQSAVTTSGSADKRLSIAYKTVATQGSATVSGTLAVGGPWVMHAVVLRPTVSSIEVGRWAQWFDGEFITPDP